MLSHQKEAALLLILGTLLIKQPINFLEKLPDCVFISDEKNHASMIQELKTQGQKN